MPLLPLLLLLLSAQTVIAAPNEYSISQIIIEPHAIFDEQDEDTVFIHRWANFLHIQTKEKTILRALPFQLGDTVSQQQLDETERILRQQPYLRDCQLTVRPDPRNPKNSILTIDTWDNWTLLPTVSISRTGGENKAAIGIKDDNFLGLGISTSVRYRSDQDRNGYRFTLDAPIYLIPHARAGLELFDNSDGQVTRLYFNKPFYTLNTRNHYEADYYDGLSSVSLRQNDVEWTGFHHQAERANISYGWLGQSELGSYQRWFVGVSRQRDQFRPWLQFPNAQLPQERHFIYPWLAWQYIEDAYQVFHNIHLINYNEDINLGWQHYLKLGLETKDKTQGLGYHFWWQSQRGWRMAQHLWLLELQGQTRLNTRQADFYRLSLKAEWFYRFDPKWTLYHKVRLRSSHNNYLDQPLTLGDFQGLRGYPNDYQWGDQQWLLTSELRNYPNINLYQMAELGWALFTDVGQAFGDNNHNNDLQGILGAVGLGLRVYSSRSSYGNVGHLDLTAPLRKGEGISDWEWRLQVKGRF